ncbi:MAG: phosphate acetyltransferase [Legionellaceae bacterium]|nr:phosphate acetyltransferase [Legionellaceae bacterium]
MGKKIYLTAIERKKGKSFISTGMAASLKHIEPQMRCYRLFAEKDQEQTQLLSKICAQTVTPLMPIQDAIGKFRNAPADLLADIIDFLHAEPEAPVRYFEGSDFESDNDMTEFQFNLSIAAQLNCEVILVISANERQFSHLDTLIRSALEISRKNHARIQGIIINMVAQNQEVEAAEHFKARFPQLKSVQIIPRFDALAYPTVAEVARILKAEILCGQHEIRRQIHQFTIAAKNLNHFLESRANRKDVLIITPSDRIDILLGSLLADQSSNYPKIAGIALTGGEMPTDTVRHILDGLAHPFPVLLTTMHTYETATSLFTARFALNAQDMEKAQEAVHHLQPLLTPLMMELLEQDQSQLSLTPALFLNDLVYRAKMKKKHIVLPEGHDPRILQAADYLLQREIVDISLLGEPDTIYQLAKRYNLPLKNVRIIDVEKNSERKRYARQYYLLRQHKNIQEPMALDRMGDVNYYAAMMVYCNDADGMVSGAIHTTADTVRPALEIIKTKTGVQRVSSIFIMCLPSRILIYGDCAINPEPDSATLAEIAIQAATISARLGIPPRVALLSYSSGRSGQGASVDKVVKALEIVNSNAPDLLAEGPIQYDAAVDPEVAASKLPNSRLAGDANVLIFPDLNTGNNTYKAVQRETGALAIGPILLGLNKPVNDLSRGCNIQDIINTILITAIQAQEP